MELTNNPECQVLGALLLDPDYVFQIQEVLSEDDFASSRHRKIFKAILATGDNCDVFTVADEIGDVDENIVYLNDMADCCPSSKNVLAYAQVVLESGRQRKLRALSQMILESQQSKEKSEVILDKLGEAISLISTNGIGNTQKTLNEALKEVVAQVNDRMEGIGEVYKSGFDELDESMPMEGGMLYFLGGLSSMGKTTLLQSLIENQIFGGVPVYFNSAEMSASQVAKRFLQSAGSITSNFFKDPAKHISTQIGQSMTAGLLKLKDRNLLIDDEQGLTSAKLKVRARNWITSQESYQKNGRAMLVVDYIQLMEYDHKSPSPSLGAITKDLRALAKELKIPVIILGQLNNDYKTRTDKRPVSSDIAGSNEIYKDSDGVIFCYRDEVFNEDTNDKGIMEIIMGKNRDGNIGTVRASAEMQYYRVKDIKSKY
jgi:replicative DNA helicase